MSCGLSMRVDLGDAVSDDGRPKFGRELAYWSSPGDCIDGLRFRGHSIRFESEYTTNWRLTREQTVEYAVWCVKQVRELLFRFPPDDPEHAELYEGPDCCWDEAVELRIASDIANILAERDDASFIFVFG